MKRPAFQFYPADWRKDMALQSCSVAARGLWMDMLCIAHECEPYGHLTVNGKAMTAAQIGRHTGLTEREAKRLIAELDDAGVASRTDEGVIFSRRMVRDEDIRNRRAEGGKAGSEHGFKGAEHGAKGGRPPKERGDNKPPLEPPPSSSSSSSTSVDGAARAPRPAKKCPTDFVVTDDMVTWARSECPGVSISAETPKFRDHTFATAATDWPGRWRNWMRKAAEMARPSERSSASAGRPRDIFEGNTL